jgi:glutathione S-transferase
MELFFSPLACSMATRITLDEAERTARFVAVDPRTKLTEDGDDFRQLNPLGLVPTLRTDDGELLTENAAILQYIAQGSTLAPDSGIAHVRLQQWLCFIGTELHKGLFTPLLDKSAAEQVKSYAMDHAASRLRVLESHLSAREYLLDRFSVADAYLFTVLNWAQATRVDLRPYPALYAYVLRLRERPSIKRALAVELPLYLREKG